MLITSPANPRVKEIRKLRDRKEQKRTGLFYMEGLRIIGEAFDKGAEAPQFKECARHPHIDENGYVLYYTSQCPFNAKYVPVLEKTAEENGIPFRAVHIGSREEAQNAPAPVTTYALFRDGEYITNEQMNDKKFLKLVKGS